MRRSILFLLVLFLITGCGYDFEKINLNDLIFSPEDSNVKKDEYKDENSINISIYTEMDNNIKRIDETYSASWIAKKDIVVLSSFLSEEGMLFGNYYQEIWKSCLANYEEKFSAKIGWMISFRLKNGNNIKRVIFNPEDVTDIYNYLEIYLYDSVNQPIGSWYSHLTMNDMTEETLLTTMKITAGSDVDEVENQIVVSVFTYDDMLDFDENGIYRGNSIHEITVSND